MNKKSTSPSPESAKPSGIGFHFHRNNYLLFFAGILLLVLGNILLFGGGTDNPNEFKEEIYNSQRLVVAPLVLMSGFVAIGFAIMWRFKK